MSDSLVIIPTYNEKENVERMIRKVFSLDFPFHLLIVDDGSPDGTANIVKSLQQNFSDKLFLEERTGKLGLGTAYIHGFEWALARNYEYVFEIEKNFYCGSSKQILDTLSIHSIPIIDNKIIIL